MTRYIIYIHTATDPRSRRLGQIGVYEYDGRWLRPHSIRFLKDGLGPCWFYDFDGNLRDATEAEIDAARAEGLIKCSATQPGSRR